MFGTSNHINSLNESLVVVWKNDALGDCIAVDVNADVGEIDEGIVTLDMNAYAHVGDIDKTVDNDVETQFVTLDPSVGMEFKSENDARIFYDEYAKHVGFITRTGSLRRSKYDGTIIGREFLCSKQGFRDKKHKSTRPITREGCKARMMIKRQLESGNWVTTIVVTEHNHPLVSSGEAHLLRPLRRVRDPTKNLLKLSSDDVAVNLQNCTNYLQRVPKQSRGKDTQLALQYFQHMQATNPGFFYAMQVDDDYHITGFFWVESGWRMAYNYFGDVVTFNIIHRTNRCGMPFVQFVGVNHHKQSIFFGCALLLDETEASFIWLFSTFLEAMHGRQPKAIITDLDAAMGAAIAKVLPRTCHRFCKQHILRKFPEHLGHLERKHLNFKEDFCRCINMIEPNEFESYWRSFIDKYGVGDDLWLQLLFRTHEQWVQVYIQAQSNESINSLFDEYLNKYATLRVFFNQCQKAIDNHYEKQVDELLKINYTKPDIKMGLPMEKQALEAYTRTIFLEFQEQLFQSGSHIAEMTKENGPVSTFRVMEFGVDGRDYAVIFNALVVEASCSCQMFEYTGILCRHALVVFRMKNVMLLPPHYILKRWTKNATSDDTIAEMQAECEESLSLRYNDLCHRVIKCATEGATSKNTYNVAVLALQKAFDEIAATKENDEIVVAEHSSPQNDVT